MNNVECYSPKVIKTLFALLRCALNDDDQLRKIAFEKEREKGNLDLLSFSAKEWNELYSLSAEQGVMALTYDVLKSNFLESEKDSGNIQNKLPFEIKKVMVEWEISCMAVIKRYHKHLEVIKEICSCVIPQPKLGFLILKGVAFSAYYPKPHLRESGDIDIYFYKNREWFENFFKTSPNSVFAHSSKKHICFIYKNVPIEYHYKFLNTHLSKIDKQLNEILKQISSETKLIEIQSTEIETGSAEFNFILMIRHAMVHFLASSISIRHFLDIAAFINKNPQSEFDYQKIRKIFEQHNLHKLYDAFLCSYETYFKQDATKHNSNIQHYNQDVKNYVELMLNDSINSKKQLKELRRIKKKHLKDKYHKDKYIFGIDQPTIADDIKYFHKKVKHKHDQKWKFSIITKMSYYSNIWMLIKEKIRTHFSLYH